MGKVKEINEHRLEKFLLPYFKIKVVSITVTDGTTERTGSAYEVTCPRPECRKKFIISRHWKKRRLIGTSACPNCSKFSIIPGGSYRGP